MRKGMQAVVLLLLLSFLLGGCDGADRTVTQSSEKKDDVIRIGMSFDSFVIERWIRDRDTFIKTAKELGAEVNVQNANGSVKEQISQIEYFIDRGVDAIVVIAVDCDALRSVVSRARSEGIKVVAYDRLLNHSDVDLYISFDNEEVGSLMAQTMMDRIPQGGNIAEIRGSQSDNNVTLVMKGFEDILSSSTLKVSYTANCENWEADQASDYMEQALSEDPSIVGVMCGNDDIATRVYQVLAEHRMAGTLIIVGQDADLSACQRIVEGTQSMTVFKQVEDEAHAAAYLTVALVKDDDITDVSAEYATRETINDGTYDVPYYKLSPVAVTKANIDRIIIDSGFHERDDVYLNVQH